MNTVATIIPTTPPRRIWPWVLAGLLLLGLLSLGSGLAWLVEQGMLHHGFDDDFVVVLGGEEWHGNTAATVLAVMAAVLAGGAALVVGVLAVLLVLPLGLALGLLGVALGLAVAVFSIMAVGAALLLPLWLPLLLVWLLWRLLRTKPAAPATARMPA